MLIDGVPHSLDDIVLLVANKAAEIVIARLGVQDKELSMAMEKYAVDQKQVQKLLNKGLVKDEQEGIEKVASGEAEALLEKKKRESKQNK
tara:strand:+ start:751 stop:1020 length:270 start_codon:yes stop_codon:yes gene_type:complete